jgi:hypothetical protein
MNMRVFFTGLLARRALTAMLLMSAAIEAASQGLPRTPVPTLQGQPAPCPGGTALVANMHTQVTVGASLTSVLQLPLPVNCKFVLTATASVAIYSGELRCWLYSLPSMTLVSEGVAVWGAATNSREPLEAAITVIGVDATGGDTIALECLSRNGTLAGQANFISGAISAVSASTLTTY